MNKVNDNTLLWQVVNVVLPSALVIILGLILALIRKRKFTK